MKSRALLAAVLVAGVMAPATVAHAAISASSGQVSVISPPASTDALASNTTGFAWSEQQGVTLASALGVDIVTPGTYNQGTDLVNASIPAGTFVDSDFFHTQSTTGSRAFDATLTFPTDVIGIVLRFSKLVDSDVLGAPGTTYSAMSSRSFELGTTTSDDQITLSSNLRTVTVHSMTGQNADEIRILTKHNSPPTASAGGPYSGFEGAAIALHGTAHDNDNDALTTTWSFATTGSPGTVCTPTAATTLNPTLTCNDNAVVTATLSVKDASHPAVLSTAQVTVGNLAPALGTLTLPTAPVAQIAGSVSASFTDAGTNDAHTATVDWGDTTADVANVSESNGSGSLSRTHTYTAGGLYTVTVTLRDDDGGSAVRKAVLLVNGAPTANANGPYATTEGSSAPLAGSASDPENDPLTTTWTFTPTGTDPGTVCTPTGSNGLIPTVTCNDDAVVQSQLSVSDNINPPTISNTTVTVSNVAPSLSPLTANGGPLAVGDTASISASFSDAGTNDTHSASVNWGDLSTTNATINESNGSGSLLAGHAYSQAGLYTVTVTLADDNGGTNVRTTTILVNTPPVVDAGGPYAGFEGSVMTLGGVANDVDGDSLAYTWTFSSAGDPGSVCSATGAGVHALTLALVCNDDAVVTATLSVSDGVNAPVTSTTTLNVGNASPTVGVVSQANTAPPGASAAISAPFTDPGTNDTHSATIDWGDGHTTAGSVTETNGSGTVHGSHLYATDGSYTIVVTVTDDNGGAGTATTDVVSDTTPPVIVGTVSPAPNGAGWNHSVATITWSVTDAVAPIDSMTGCDPTTLSSDSSGTSFTCTATSRGGTASKSVTVKLDQVAPLLSGAATSVPNSNGWYNSPVTIHWTCSDALSGIAGSCPSNSTVSSEGVAATASASAFDVAGNETDAASTPVQIDTHAPVTTASAIPTWNNNDVVLTLSATDNLSGVDSTSYTVDGGPVQSGDSIVLTTEGVHTVKYWSTDAAGNVEDANTATVRIDRTAPTITSAQDPTANAAGWNNTDVTITFTCGDSLSGIASCSGPHTVTAQGAGQDVTGTAADAAGNTASTTASVNIDKTPPTIHGSVPAANAAGWFNSPVSVGFTCADSLSGVAACPAPTTLSSDGAGQSVTGLASDTADNTATSVVDGINIDQTAPTITASLDPAANTSGWNNGTTTVEFSCSDATSGVAPGACPADVDVSADGVSTVAGTVLDRAGNAATASIVVRIDTTAPGIVGAQTPAPNGAGWNNTDVTVSFTCTDDGSGIATAGCSPPTPVGEGANQAVTGTALDTAGNTATATVANINVDETAPVLSGAPTTASNGAGWYDDPVTIHWTCSDALSGIAGGCPADSVISSEGTHQTASASVSDVAGNSVTATSVAVNIDRTAPATTVSSVPDWSNGVVNLTLAATDNLSGVDATKYTVDGGGAHTGTAIAIATAGIHTVQFWSTDQAGNTEDADSVLVKIDLSAPAITAAPTPAANGAGWNKTNVTVTFVCTDPDSGVASCTSPQTVTSEGPGQAVTGTAVDNAGNAASATATLNIDKTPPTVTPSVPPANANGWYNGPVTANWICNDGLSGIASCTAPTTLSSDGTGQSMSGSATHSVGNSATASVSGVKIDQVPPVLSDSEPATATGWYSGPVTITWNCSDALSGVTSCPASQTITAEGVTTVAETISDKAGNLTTDYATIRIDKTPPTIAGTATPAANGNGWNNADVTVSFACADALSGIASRSSPSTLGEGTGQSVTGHAADLAGNSADATVSHINVDKTAPTLSGAPTSSANTAGWYKTAVTIHWTCGDARSGVDAATCPTNSVISSEGAAQQISRSVSDLAGNTTSATSPAVNIDLTPPLTSAVATAHTSSVTVALTATDNLSGVSQTKYTVDGGSAQTGNTITITGTATHTITYYSVDKAGNVEGTHVATVKLDSTAPTITSSQSPAPNSAGWNKTNVTVTFTCTDSGGIASCTPPKTVTTEGVGQHVAGTAIDNAGNSATATATVSIDKTPPTIVGSLSRAANAAGWYNAAVSATFACGDSLSGVAACTSPVTFGSGTGQTATGTAVDVAGNSTSTSVGPVNVDTTKPTITTTVSGMVHNGVYSGSVTIHFTCTDALSGIVPTTGCPTDRVVTSSGTTTVTGTATDRAGNTATTSVVVTLKRVCEREQDTIIDIDGYRGHASYGDAQKLRGIMDLLGAFDDPSRCFPDNHVDHNHGHSCYGSQHDAVFGLHGLIGIHSVPSSVINGWMDDLADGSRVVAQTALDDANSQHGSSYWIGRSQSEMNAGDQSQGNNDFVSAISHYQNAWDYAQNA